MRTIIWFAVFFLCTVLTPSYAEDGNLCAQDQIKTAVFFANGISNTILEAVNSLSELKAKLRTTLPRDQFNALDFKIAYNNSHGVLLDLFESVKQKVGGDTYADSFWRWISNLDPMPDWLQEVAKTSLTAIDQTRLVSDGDLVSHLAMYRARILEGRKVLVVAHSQGNLFANAAYNILYNGSTRITSRSFGIVSVANPASFVGGGGPYSTLSNDLIIGAIAAASHFPIAPPLPANVVNATWGADTLGHNFLNAYMPTGSVSESKILVDIITTMHGLEQPPAIAMDGIITVTMTWGAQPDVDLHAFEPNGAHVYYSALHGPSGTLDVDDTSSYGPEHYTVSCNTLEIGTYRIGVNYFSGNSPETALVQIKAGLLVRSFTVALPTELGSSGNASPTTVADIIVTGDAITGFSFAVNGSGV